MSDAVEPVRHAVLLAAGRGERLFPETQDKPKPLVKVGGISLLRRLLHNLRSIGIEHVLIVCGYKCDMVRAEAAASDLDLNIKVVENERYRDTNNIYSLWRANAAFAHDLLLLEGDILIDPAPLAALARLPRGTNAALASPKTHNMSGSCLTLDESRSRICELGPPAQLKRDAEHFKTVNVYRLSGAFASGWLHDALEDVVRSEKLSDYYETLFSRAIACQAAVFVPVMAEPEAWLEIDTIHDLDIAKYRVLEPGARVGLITGQHGGYWRYDIVDHSLIYNYHYPPPAFFAELAPSLPYLMREYPAAQTSIAPFLAALYDVDPDTLVLGNGASEIIRGLRGLTPGAVVVPTPSFNEFDTLAQREEVIHFSLSAEADFAIDPDALAAAARAACAGLVVITTPNNPTGTATPKARALRVLELLRRSGTRVLFDESFIDFQNGGRDNSLVPHCADYPHLAVIVSLSKAHSVAGARLGVLMSEDRAFVSRLRASLPIWNINGFAEHYARHACALRKSHLAACRTVRSETDALSQRLAAIPHLRVHPTQANFVFCRIDPGCMSGTHLRNALLSKHNILIKDCSNKQLADSAQYVRITSRSHADNMRLAALIAAELSGAGR